MVPSRGSAVASRTWERFSRDRAIGAVKQHFQTGPTPLYEPAPRSKRLRINSTPATKQFSAVETHARFSENHRPARAQPSPSTALRRGWIPSLAVGRTLNQFLHRLFRGA